LNRRRVVYYDILLIIISGELLGEINYIIVRFLEYDTGLDSDNKKKRGKGKRSTKIEVRMRKVHFKNKGKKKKER